tara:strand:- start:83 stop:1606 length:1524 start_codon:yes stop_codon:yes gene_type:complete
MNNNNTTVILGASAAISVIVLVYLIIHTHKKKCKKGSIMKNGKCVPDVPKCNTDDKITCPNGTEAVCNSATKFEWICESTSGCDGTPPTCSGSDIPTCNSETKKWECPIQKCSTNPPPGLECPDDNLSRYVQRCNEQTRNKWVCQKACLKTPPKSFDPKSCTSNQQPACSAETNFLWSCQNNAFDVCGINPRPSCAGAICFDTESGWNWKCPGALTRDDVKLLKSLQCRDIVNGDDNTKKVNICFSGDTPIAPSVSSNCDEQNPNMEIGQDFTNVIDNPEGNIGGKDKTEIFYPYDPTKRIYRKADQSDVACILSMDLQNGCKNGGKFQQSKPGISKEGTCACINGWTGKTCQYSDALCNGHGKVDSNGKCKCDDGYFSVDDIKVGTGAYEWDPIYFSSGQCKVTAKDKCYTYQCESIPYDDEGEIIISKPLPCSPNLKKADNSVYKMYTTTEADCSKYTQKSPNGYSIQCMKAEGCQYICTNSNDSSCKCRPYPDKDPNRASTGCN